MLGTITEDGDRFFSRFDEYVAAAHAKHLLLVQGEACHGTAIVILDGTAYARASAVMGQQVRDDLALVRLPASSPELDAVEACRNRPDDALGTRVLDSLEELSPAIDTACYRITVLSE